MDPEVERYAYLIRQLLPVMEQIGREVSLAVTLGAMMENERQGIILAHLPDKKNFSFHLTPGVRFFLHTSAPGKALMAILPPVRLEKLLGGLSLERFNDRTITSKPELRRVLKEVLKLGYGWDLAERFEGSYCVGVPVFSAEGEALAAIWVHGPSSLVPRERFGELAAVLHRHLDNRAWTLTPDKRTDVTDSVNSIVDSALRLLETNVHTTVDLQAFAASRHISYTWFRRIFKRKTGTSPHQYQLSLRMAQAETFLLKSALTVTEISARLGFESPYYFSHIFKLKHGVSPSRYRERKGLRRASDLNPNG